MIKFVLVGISAGRYHDKDRWECPHCRTIKMSECRFNLSKDKRSKKHICRYCKSEGILGVSHEL